jgi:RNA recognition motif-containing protein
VGGGQHNTTLEQPASQPASMRLHVGNLPPNTTQEELQSLFSRVGEGAQVHLPRDSITGLVKGFAFVNLGSEELAEKAAKAFDGSKWRGCKLKIAEAKPGYLERLKAEWDAVDAVVPPCADDSSGPKTVPAGLTKLRNLGVDPRVLRIRRRPGQIPLLVDPVPEERSKGKKEKRKKLNVKIHRASRTTSFPDENLSTRKGRLAAPFNYDEEFEGEGDDAAKEARLRSLPPEEVPDEEGISFVWDKEREDNSSSSGSDEDVEDVHEDEDEVGGAHAPAEADPDFGAADADIAERMAAEQDRSLGLLRRLMGTSAGGDTHAKRSDAPPRQPTVFSMTERFDPSQSAEPVNDRPLVQDTDEASELSPPSAPGEVPASSVHTAALTSMFKVVDTSTGKRSQEEAAEAKGFSVSALFNLPSTTNDPDNITMEDISQADEAAQESRKQKEVRKLPLWPSLADLNAISCRFVRQGSSEAIKEHWKRAKRQLASDFKKKHKVASSGSSHKRLGPPQTKHRRRMNSRGTV